MQYRKNVYLCIRVSHTRPAPIELPQGRKAARVDGCSGAMYSAYPFSFLAYPFHFARSPACQSPRLGFFFVVSCFGMIALSAGPLSAGPREYCSQRYSSSVFWGKVTHFPAFLVHFPAEKVDSTTISPFFSGKVNRFAAFLVHFPAENVDFTAISPFFPGKVNQFAANQVHFPPLLNTDSQRIHKVGYTSRFHFVIEKQHPGRKMTKAMMKEGKPDFLDIFSTPCPSC